MALDKVTIKRSFVMTGGKDPVTLADPDPDMTPEQVRKFYAGRYPELVTCTTVGPAYKDDKMVYTFKAGIGTKG